MEAIYSKSALRFGEVHVCRYIHSKQREQKVTYGYMHAVADRLPEVSGHDKWIGKTGRRGCCHCIPRVVDLVAKGVHDAAGTLLCILSTFILSTGLFLIF